MSQLFQYPFNPAIGIGPAPVFLPLATMSFYLTGTTTLAAIYNSLGTTLPNPITANAYGQFPAIYLDNAVTYRVVLKDRFGALVPGCDIDPINQNDTTLQTFMAGFAPSLATFFSGASPLPIIDGGTGGTNGATARTALGAAASGVNNDITQLTGLTSPTPITGGGTGAITAAAALVALGGLRISSATLTLPAHITFTDGTHTFILQAGQQACPNSTDVAVTYPVPFTTFGVPFASGGQSGSAAASRNAIDVVSGSESITGFNMSNSQVMTLVGNWFAFGV